MNSRTQLLITLTSCILACSPVTAGEKDKKKDGKAPVTIHTQTAVTAAPAQAAPPTPVAATAPITAPTVATTPESSSTPSISSATSAALASTPAPATTTAPSSPALTAATAPAITTSSSALTSKSAREAAPTTAIDYSCVTSLPTSSVTSIKRHPEQILGLSYAEFITDAARFRTLSHENYLKHHVTGQTLAVVLPTAEAQRAKFCHAANELVQKAIKRAELNTIKRMAAFIGWADMYNIELSDADLRVMKEQTELQIKDALATLALLNSKIKTKPTNPSPFDLVGIQKEESKRVQQQEQ